MEDLHMFLNLKKFTTSSLEGISCSGPNFSGKSTFVQTLKYFLDQEIPKEESIQVKKHIQQEMKDQIQKLFENNKEKNQIEIQLLKSIENSEDFFYQITALGLSEKVSTILKDQTPSEVTTFLN